MKFESIFILLLYFMNNLSIKLKCHLFFYHNCKDINSSSGMPDSNETSTTNLMIVPF